jgi:hypothetical protein
MAFIIELRKNDFTSAENEVEAWTGLIERDYGHGPVEVPAPVAKRAAATEFHSRTEARNTLNRLSDEFFDRYAAEIVGIT